MRTATLLVAILALGGCRGGADERADERADEPAARPTQAVGVIVHVEGDVMSVQAPAGERGPAGWWLRRGDGVRVSRGDERLSWTSLQEGQPVRVTYGERDGAMQAREVEVLTGAEAERLGRGAGPQRGTPPPPKDASPGGGAPPPPRR